MSNVNKENSYRNILRGTSLMGGVQFFQILISLIRGKFVAILLGPEGMGINAIFTSTSTTLSQMGSLGVTTATVKEISASRDQESEVGIISNIVIGLMHISGIISALLCIICAPWLSELSFGTKGYTWQFMLLGPAIYFYIVSNIKLNILQGLHKLGLVSRATLVSGLAGLILCLPLYYLFGNVAIVPGIVLIAFTSLIYNSISLKKALPQSASAISRERRKEISWNLIKLGLLMISPAIISSGCQYILNIFIRFAGSLDDVGLFNAANSITNQYSALIFTAIAMDYFPRLSAAKNDNKQMIQIVNRQSEVVALIVAPLIVAVILFAPIIIRVLLADSFITITPLVRWMALGILFKGLSFPLGYISFAKDNKRLFFWLETIIGNFLYIVLSFPAFSIWGIIGLGYALVAENIILIAIYYAVNSHYYHYNFSSDAAKTYILTISTGIAALACIFIKDIRISYSLLSFLLIISAIHSFISLRRKIASSSDNE